MLVGPDLIAVAKWSHDDVKKALIRMQDNVGPLKPEQMEALISLLQSGSAKEQIAQAANPPVIEVPPEEKAASAAAGRRLFFGQQHFANRGVPCFGCHAVAGRGGNLAIDLTNVHARRNEASLLTTAETPAFPLMKAAYTGHPVTRQEAWHLLAFFRETHSAVAARERMAVPHGITAGLTLLVFAGVAVVLRTRRAGVRSRMVRKSSGGA